jgi:hypothetical protein
MQRLKGIYGPLPVVIICCRFLYKLRSIQGKEKKKNQPEQKQFTMYYEPNSIAWRVCIDADRDAPVDTVQAFFDNDHSISYHINKLRGVRLRTEFTDSLVMHGVLTYSESEHLLA